MGRVIFMRGPAGSGKSTVARRYEQQGMTRLSFDQEAWSRGITTMPPPPDVHREIEDVLRTRLVGGARRGQTWSWTSHSGAPVGGPWPGGAHLPLLLSSLP